MGQDENAERRLVAHGALLRDVPKGLDAERFETLLRTGVVRFERIISNGQTTPTGEWYDQAWDEWVTVLSGAAALLVEGEPEPHRLEPGDWLFLPAHVRHRVTYTAVDEPTVWLAVHIGEPD